MTIDKAIKALLKGKGIQLPEWNQLFYIVTEKGVILTDNENHFWGGFHLNEKELMRNDWVVIKERKKQ